MRKVLLAVFLMNLLSGMSIASDFPAKDVYEKTSKSVVLLIAYCESSGNAAGAGSIISDKGFVLTNAHIVVDKKNEKACPEIRVYFKPDKVTGKFQRDLVHKYAAKVINYSIDLDLALLQLEEPPVALAKIDLANPDEIKTGEEVIAIGHPEQGGLWTLTYGRISGEIENQSDIPGKDVYQTDTSINRGNSGGPLLDGRGYLVGVNTNIARVGYDNLAITGVNFSVKSSVVKKWLNKNGYMIAYGKELLVEKEKKIVSMPAEKDIPAPSEESKAVSEESLTQKTPTPDVQNEEKAGEVKTGETEQKTIHSEEMKSEPVTEQKEVEKESSTAKEQVEPEDKVDEKAEDKDIRKGNDKKETPEIKEPEKTPENKFETPRRPYDYDALFKAVEEDLENMMEEMKGKIRR